MKRQLSSEVTTMVSPGGDERVEGQAPDDLEQRRRSEIVAVKTRRPRQAVKPRANHKIAAVGTTLRQKNKKICIRMLRVSSNQIGCAYRQAPAVRFSSVQRPVRRAGAPSHISCGPTSAEDGGERSDPGAAAHRHVVGDGGPHPDLAAALEVNRADVQACPDHLVVWM